MIGVPKNRYRLHVSMELLLIMLTATSFFNIAALDGLFRDEGGFFLYLFLLVFVYIRNMGLQIRFGIAQKMLPLMWMLIGVLISFIPAYIYYGQHLYYSVIVYRFFLAYFALVVLLSIRPSPLEISRALYAFSVVYFVVLIYCSYINQRFVLPDPDKDFIAEGDFVHYLQGAEYLVLALIYSLDDMRKHKIGVKNSMQVLFLLIVIFLIQNRTILFATFLVTMLAALSIRSARQRLTRGVVIGFMLIAGVIMAYHYIFTLVMETMSDLNNPDYNRVKAFYYFISGENGLLSYFWGNGFISGRVNSVMADLMRDGIYNSDLGLIGFWHQFGLLPVLVILYLIFSGLSRKHSYIVRANALFLLAGVVTIAYFRNLPYSLWLCIFMYLYATDTEYETARRADQAKTVKRLTRWYRSLSNG